MKKDWLTINIYINAWLDCSNPFISLHNKFDDDVLAHFNTERVTQLIEDGELVVEDLQSSDPLIQMDVISDLIAIQSGEAIKKQIVNMSLAMKRREPKPEKQYAIQVANLFPAPILKAI